LYLSRLQHGAGRALAVGPADGDDRAPQVDFHSLKNFPYSFEAQGNGLRMLLLDEAQPVGEALHARLFR
jgi:hypothetical protein